MSFLKSVGCDCKFVPQFEWSPVVGKKMGYFLSVIVTHPPRAYFATLNECPDVVIVSKTATPQMYLFQKLLLRKNVKFVFDLTDAIYLPNLTLFGLQIRSGSFDLERILINSDCATTNGHFLADFTSKYNSNTVIIHDPIDTHALYPVVKKDLSDCVTLGWEGNAFAHLENLEMLLNPLRRLGEEFKIKLKLVSSLGNAKVKELFSDLEGKIEVDYGPRFWLPVNQFIREISDFDIFMAPIKDTPWYNGKSALRVGIGMALGIPVVASPVGEQKYLIKNRQNGFIATSEEDWYYYLKLLIQDEKLRRSIGYSGRQTVERELSLEVCGAKLIEVLKNL
ncbi:MAG: glycosyltransferase [Bacillota bacterium]